MILNIVAVLLTVVFLNVIVSKSLHEFFEHEHVEHTCENKDVTHYHAFELTHIDFICDFHFSANFLNKYHSEIKNVINYVEKQVRVKFIWLANNIYLDNLLLRGPPSIK